MRARRPVINLVFLGDVDHGKSTLVGRLLYDLGKISGATVARLRELASQVRDESYFLAYVVDRQLEERRRGHTIEASSWEPVEAGGKAVKMIDVPGVSDWMNNAISGIAQADAAVVVVDAKDALSRGLASLESLREHLILALAFGIEQLVVAVNKMDLLDYDKSAFERLCDELAAFLKQLGHKDVDSVPFVPISALRGDNVVERSDKMAWYSGPTLYEAIGALKEPTRMIEAPLRLPIYRHFERGNIAVGVVASGVLRVGDAVAIVPAGAGGEVVSVESWGEALDEAYPGEDVGVKIRGVARYHLKKGFVISHPEGAPRPARRLVGRVRVVGPRGLWPGFCPTMYCHQARAPCRVVEVLRKVDPETGRTIEEGPGSLAEGEAGDVLLEPLVPRQKGLVIERHEDLPPLGRFVLRASIGTGRGTLTVAAGTCLDVEPHD